MPICADFRVVDGRPAPALREGVSSDGCPGRPGMTAQRSGHDRCEPAAARGPAAAHRQGPLSRRHFAARAAACRVRAQPASACARSAASTRARRWRCPASMRCSRSTTSRRCSRSGACCGTRIPARRSTGCGRSRSPTARSPTSAKRWRSWSPTAAISPRTRAALVAVDYEVLGAVADCRKAGAPNAPAVRRELNNNIVATLEGRVRRRRMRPSPRPRTSSTRSSGSIAAPGIRSRAAASSPTTGPATTA